MDGYDKVLSERYPNLFILFIYNLGMMVRTGMDMKIDFPFPFYNRRVQTISIYSCFPVYFYLPTVYLPADTLSNVSNFSWDT